MGHWLSLRSRCSWRWAVVLCGVAALSTIQLYSFCRRVGSEYKKLARVMALQPPVLTFEELEQVEYLTLLPPYGLKHPQTINLNDEFLNESSNARTIFFPSYGAVDPRKKTNTTSHTGLFYWPGKVWLDTGGNPINAHGGGIIFDGTSTNYYWYGEFKNGRTYHAQGSNTARVDVIGVSCYSSKNLWEWKFEGIVLHSEKMNVSHDLHLSNVLERPKVIYNEETKKYVMWFHVDNAAYTKAAAGVAVSDSPTGPFEYLHSVRPNGFESRDMTVFKDEDDGRAYLIYSSVRNREIHISPLSQDYLGVSGVTERALIGMYREAPAVFKNEGVYYMVTSGCSGWLPNEALVHEAEAILGPWETIGNPCVGANKAFRAATFFSQGSFVLPMPGGERGSFIFMADRWNAAELSDSRYLWLPLTVKARYENERFTPFPLWSRVAIFWHERWRTPIKENGETYYVAKPYQLGEDL
ncbi:Arabinanase/levansucrase/invertase [Perilla frutescens var. frutescens]|nr:Arabinanase/levansucrase/invertase [Perilla frutescens var. frutescens]